MQEGTQIFKKTARAVFLRTKKNIFVKQGQLQSLYCTILQILSLELQVSPYFYA
jgi:hypothetical protein